MEITFRVTNRGRTTAKNIDVRFSSVCHPVGEAPLLPEYGAPDRPHWGTSLSPTTLGEGESFTRTYQPLLRAPENVLEDVLNHRAAVWTIGRIYYTDVFDKTHSTNFSSACWPTKGAFVFWTDKGYNDAN